MPETDIFNPIQPGSAGDDVAGVDNLTPDFGFQRKRSITKQSLKGRSGQPYSRNVTDEGHAIPLSWLKRPYSTAQAIKRYYEQYEDGYFTIVDWEGNGRHYVGRFTDEPILSPVGSNQWTIQNLTFTELPGVPMVNYPSDWANDAVWRYVYDDSGGPRWYYSGVWNFSGVPGTPSGYVIANSAHDGTSFAMFEYFGYGFRLYAPKGPALGKIDVYLDGVLVSTLDLYAAADTGFGNVLGPLQLTQQSVSLGIHRIKVVARADHNAASSGYEVAVGAIQVMR